MLASTPDAFSRSPEKLLSVNDPQGRLSQTELALIDAINSDLQGNSFTNGVKDRDLLFGIDPNEKAPWRVWNELSKLDASAIKSSDPTWKKMMKLKQVLEKHSLSLNVVNEPDASLFNHKTQQLNTTSLQQAISSDKS